MFMKKFFVLLLLSLAVVSFGAADKKSVRIVSLSPNITETVFALGKGKCLVGRSNVCDYPEAAKKIPIAGRFARPNVERVIVLKPDYVVSSALQDQAMIKRFEQFGIKVLFLPDKSFADYFKTLKILGEILDCSKKAELICKRDKAELEKFKQTTERIPEKDKVKVLFVIQDTPLYTIGKKSFITDMIKLAGGVSITGEQPEAYLKCSLEWVLLHQPDVLILPAMPESRVKELGTCPGWKNFNAVKNGKLFYKMNPDLVSRMGPRSIEGIKLLQKIFKSVKRK
jgi:iron complex transport system substrate-binding protein